MGRYAKIQKNDIVNGNGVCVSFWTQGCPHRCPGCHNPETWDYEGGKDFSAEALREIMEAIENNGVKRNLSILGGEPLMPSNLVMVENVIRATRAFHPESKIYLWTGYTLEEMNEKQLDVALSVDYLIDGRFELDKKDLTIGYGGSTNQRLIDVQATKKSGELKKLDSFKNI